ncbi:hypothetical protein [Flammeovirga sp. SJP92]|uniref:hypothetical protein n=1 Tax=Flammeovirga sp. SJP92 TaxID=1775430 RepID=UPI000788BABC|nr:hypothetical protein [Flammeovirga sp. SJP92]KXX69338.1 hypothetical protein AVL50_19635 [Flammeovirga sp. SJP92]
MKNIDLLIDINLDILINKETRIVNPDEFVNLEGLKLKQPDKLLQAFIELDLIELSDDGSFYVLVPDVIDHYEKKGITNYDISNYNDDQIINKPVFIIALITTLLLLFYLFFNLFNHNQKIEIKPINEITMDSIQNIIDRKYPSI